MLYSGCESCNKKDDYWCGNSPGDCPQYGIEILHKEHCNNCRFYYENCEYKDNVYYLDSPLFRIVKKYHRNFFEINKTNDCKWFVKK